MIELVNSACKMAFLSKSTPIAIIGGGAFGLSTALHLVQNGYSDITVFEQDEQIPPRYSAANDLNKIVRAEYEDPFYTDLTVVRTFTAIPRFTSPPALSLKKKKKKKKY
jgi:glycine/D-amino acid oxidase-like deaminating enzyme